jgi:hypothetical protein
MANKYLRIYINDHRAAGRGGLALATRCRDRNRATPLGNVLTVIIDELREDLSILERVAGALAIPPDPVKFVAARAGELVGRLKLNGSVRSYSPLSRLLELEALLAGIDARRSLWLALQTSLPKGVAGADFGALAKRAGDQRDRLAPYHRDAAAIAFTGRVGDRSSEFAAASSR